MQEGCLNEQVVGVKKFGETALRLSFPISANRFGFAHETVRSRSICLRGDAAMAWQAAHCRIGAASVDLK
jgi:ribosomal protein L40E